MAKTIRKGRKGHSYQKMYIMKGCSKRRQNKKSSRRQRSLRQQMSNSLRQQMNKSIGLAGGNCTTCLQGGSSTNALIGAPWSATDGQAQPTSNHYAQNMYKADPQMMMQVRGGKGTKGKRRFRKGLKGGSGLMSLVPADLVNLGRDLSFNASSAYSSLTGATQPVNPSVTEGQLQSSVNLNKIVV